MKKILILIFAFVFSLYAKSSHVMIDEFADENLITVKKGAYKILEFSKMISKVKVNNSKVVEVSFAKNRNKPLQSIKVYAKKTGNTTVFVDFADSSNTQVEFNIIRDLTAINNLAKIISPELKIDQVNGEIILQGKVKTNKHKKKIIELYEKANVDIDKDLIDLMVVQEPDKMLRVKLYVVEISNDKGLEIKNSWSVGYKNYERNYSSGKEAPIGTGKEAFLPALANAVEGAVTLSGGLNAGANAVGSNFNVGLVLNYLSENNVAKVLDETTLLTLENKDARFHAGGTIYIKVQTTTDTGVPSTDVRSLNYGLQLIIKAKDIVNGKFVDLEIVTKSTDLDWANEVDGIPGFTDKTVETFVLVQNQATVVLGGLITKEDVKNYSKIPLLGDLPLIGALFRSKDFAEGKSELVFFITPEIVDVTKNNQTDKLDKSQEDLEKDLELDESAGKQKLTLK